MSSLSDFVIYSVVTLHTVFSTKSAKRIFIKIFINICFFDVVVVCNFNCSKKRIFINILLIVCFSSFLFQPYKSLNDFDFRSNNAVVQYCERVLHIEDIDELDHNELVEKIVNSYSKKEMKELLEVNEIFDIKFKKLVSIRTSYLQKIKVFCQAGNYLEDINIEEDDCDDEQESICKIAQFDKHDAFIKDLPKTQQKLLLDHMKKSKTIFYTLDSYNGDKKLKSKLSNPTKKQIRNFFAKEQNQIDLMTANDSFDDDNEETNGIQSTEENEYMSDYSSTSNNQEKSGKKSSSKSRKSDDEDDSEEEDDFDGVFGSNNGDGKGKRKTPYDDASGSTMSTRSKKVKNPYTSPPSKAMLLVSPRVKKGKKKSMTPNKAMKKKGDYSKVNVHVSVKIPKRFGDDDEEGVYYLMVTTENDKGGNLFAWRPNFLKEVFECFQEDYEEGDYWREQVLFDYYERCDKPKSDSQMLDNRNYPVFVLVIQLEVTPEILKRALPNHNNGISTEQLFVRTMFDCFWNNMVKDSNFEARLVNCIEKTYLPKDKEFDDTYPRNRISSYTSSLARCLARDMGNKQKRSDNFDKLENPEKVFHFNVPMSDHIIKPSLKAICTELKLKRTTKKDVELFEKFTGFKATRK